jgi:hypothetical protein
MLAPDEVTALIGIVERIGKWLYDGMLARRIDGPT